MVALPGTTEEFEYEEKRALTAEWLKFETEFLSNYIPQAFELRLEDVQLGGCSFTGFIDRLDVNPATGDAVVIDYKGSILPQYRPMETYYKKILGWKQDGYVQVALYAAILNRIIAERGPIDVPAGSGWVYQALTGTFVKRDQNDASNTDAADELERAAEPLLSASESASPETVQIKRVVGAVYVSYLHGNSVSGAFDPVAVPLGDLDNLALPQVGRLTSEGDYTFAAYLEEVEHMAADAVQRITEGDFEPRPANESVCTYCPVFTCSARGGGDTE